MKTNLPTLPAAPPVALDPSVVCPPCGLCCKHVAVDIGAPTSVQGVSTALWLVYHRGVSIYQDHDGDWFLLVPTDCGNLLPDGLCAVYHDRPLVCRDYDVDGCEGTSAEPAEKVRFDDAASLVAWLARKRPALYRRCVEKGVVPEALRPRP